MLPFISFANLDANLKLEPIANLQNEDIPPSNWLQLIAHPQKHQQYYLTSLEGQIYFIENGKIQSKPILDLSSTLTNKTTKFQLTAFTLHTNFSYKDKIGFATFYTAHVEPINKKSKTHRLQSKQKLNNYLYDAVITEWQLNPHTFKEVDLDSKREILRISLLNPTKNISQLSFDPYIKSWHEDFGLLYFSLLNDNQLQNHPLYSGTILRIKANRFGHRDYTVPISNPFLKNEEINNEIYLLGAQNLKAFIWPQKKNSNLLISHQYNNRSLFSMAQSGSDWRNKTPSNIRLADINTHSLLVYQGREIIPLNKQLLFIEDSRQQLNALPVTGSNKQPIQIETSQLFGQNNHSENLAPRPELKIFTDRDNELLLLEQESMLIYRVSLANLLSKASIENDQTITDVTQLSIVFFSIVLLVSSIVFILIKRSKRKKSFSVLLNRNFSRLELSASKQQINLFQHQQTLATTTLNINHIISYQVLLNNVTIFPNTASPTDGFSNAQELELRHCFANEYAKKMVTKELRTVDLVLIDNNRHKYVITVYIRQGNHLITKKRFKSVIEEVIDWCWIIAAAITPEHTEDRQPKPVIKMPAKKPLNKKKPAKKKVVPMNIQSVPNTVEQSLQPDEHNIKHSNNDDKTIDERLVDHQLVTSLEKLITFKQQDFLTDDEFNDAKKKLLHDFKPNKKGT